MSDYGGVVRIGLGPLSSVVVCDPELTRYILRHDRIFDRGGPLYDSSKAAVGDGLITCPHSTHRRQRRLLQPAFHRSRLPNYAEAMTAEIDAITGSWRQGQILEVYDEMKVYTAASVVRTLFSGDIPDAELREMIGDVTTLCEGFLTRALTPPRLHRLPIFGGRAFRRSNTRLRAALAGIVAHRRTEGVDHGDLISAMVAARDADGSGLTDTEIMDQAATFFIAGTESSAATLSWALWLLDQHPEILERLHAETDTVLSGRAAVHADLPRLRLTANIVTETLRLKSPAWLLTRVITEDIELSGHYLPRGTAVILSPYTLHHLPALYPEPDRFDPGRWESTTAAQLPRGSYLPFGDGARKCIGDIFGQIEVVLGLATISARWNLRTLPDQDTRPALAIALHPRELRMRATARRSP